MGDELGENEMNVESLLFRVPIAFRNACCGCRMGLLSVNKESLISEERRQETVSRVCAGAWWFRCRCGVLAQEK
jgi:hypothetical protein